MMSLLGTTVVSLDKANQVSAESPPAQVMETRTDCSVVSAILCLKDMFYCSVSFSLSLFLFLCFYQQMLSFIVCVTQFQMLALK